MPLLFIGIGNEKDLSLKQTSRRSGGEGENVMNIEIKNAIVTSAEITNDDHGSLSAWIYLDYGGSGQGFGGYALYLPKSFTHHKVNSGYAGHFIFRVMEIAEVSKWSELKGKTVRVKAGDSKVNALGHIVKDIWFEPSVEFKND